MSNGDPVSENTCNARIQRFETMITGVAGTQKEMKQAVDNLATNVAASIGKLTEKCDKTLQIYEDRITANKVEIAELKQTKANGEAFKKESNAKMMRLVGLTAAVFGIGPNLDRIIKAVAAMVK